MSSVASFCFSFWLYSIVIMTRYRSDYHYATTRTWRLDVREIIVCWGIHCIGDVSAFSNLDYIDIKYIYIYISLVCNSLQIKYVFVYDKCNEICQYVVHWMPNLWLQWSRSFKGESTMTLAAEMMENKCMD